MSTDLAGEAAAGLAPSVCQQYGPIFDDAVNARSLAALESACHDFAQRYGISSFILTLARPRGGTASRIHRAHWELDSIHSGPAGWSAALSDSMASCPVLQTFLDGRVEPLRWGHELFVLAGTPSRWRAYEQAGLTRGLAFVSPLGDRGLVVLDLGLSAHQPSVDLSQVLMWGQLFTTLASEATHRLLSKRAAPGADRDAAPALSQREMLTLQYAANGLSLTEIAKEQFVSRSVVERALVAARDKLGCATTVAAACRAVSLGVIDAP
ncbi:hypothetical protein KAK07_23650 [Ideonella sp. 4Y16]|uniref:helix-turn-helix transcriptional regulator n=1 Tax=Ideonella alba TaxID=2824118 RepID=UPI001B387B92|nr:LuxR C-terminal-related transcriptional regulator [Ideonella alba]MBQ0946355.1 hypothetical protein [Ideonella alba]